MCQMRRVTGGVAATHLCWHRILLYRLQVSPAVTSHLLILAPLAQTGGYESQTCLTHAKMLADMLQDGMLNRRKQVWVHSSRGLQAGVEAGMRIQ